MSAGLALVIGMVGAGVVGAGVNGISVDCGASPWLAGYATGCFTREEEMTETLFPCGLYPSQTCSRQPCTCRTPMLGPIRGPMGCVCSPGSEATCRGPSCVRRRRVGNGLADNLEDAAMSGLRECPRGCRHDSWSPYFRKRMTTMGTLESAPTCLHCDYSMGWYLTETEAETAWNRRAPVVTREEVARVLCVEAGHDPDDGNNHGSNVRADRREEEMSDHIPDPGKMVRCEPPEHLRCVVGLHILIDPHGEPDAGKWRGPDMEWWFGDHTSMTAQAAAELGWRYLSPIPSPDDLARLVEAAEEARDWHQRQHKAASKQPRCDEWMQNEHDDQAYQLRAALAPFTKEPTKGDAP